MPSDFPRSPKLQKGALVVYESLVPGTQPKTTIRFQYNPEQLSRSLAHRAPRPDPKTSALSGRQRSAHMDCK